MRSFSLASHRRPLTLGVVGIGVLCSVVGCGSNSASSAKGGLDKEGRPNKEKGASDGASQGNGNRLSVASFKWVSDKEGVVIKPCKPGQLMANAECWDEVHFKSTGVTLTRPGASFVFFENGALASGYLKSQYTYRESRLSYNDNRNDMPRKLFAGLGRSRVNEWFLSGKGGWTLDDSAVSGDPWDELSALKPHYVFAPMEAVFSLPKEDRTLERAKVGRIEFKIVFEGYYPEKEGVLQARAWRAKGSLEACGQTLDLATFTQDDLEQACNTGPAGSGARFNLTVPNGTLSLKFDPLANNPKIDRPYVIIYDFSFPDPTVTPTSTPTGGEVRP
jgi:hypothetical protein